MLARIRKTQQEKEGGFTLIELLVVIIIIGILAAIAIPVFLNQRKKGYDAQAKSDLRNFGTLEETYLTDNSAYSTTTSPFASTGATPIKMSPNNVITLLAVNGGTGFCAYSHNSNSTNYFLYDSTAGGLNNTPSTTAPSGCGVTGAPGSPATLTATASGVTAP